VKTSHPDPRVQAVVQFFESLKPEDLAGLDRIYSQPCYFKDPFNEVHELAGVRRVFGHMFETVQAPRFEVLDALAEGGQCFLSWNFHFERAGRAQRIHGSSHLRFAADGRVAYHRDYWDAAEELYETVPLLGGLLRWIKRRLRAR